MLDKISIVSDFNTDKHHAQQTLKKKYKNLELNLNVILRIISLT